MDYINYVKQYPLSMGGMGGTIGGLNFHSGSAEVTTFRGNRGIISLKTYSSTHYNNIDYYNLSSPSNAIDFGDLTVARGYGGSVAGGGGPTSSRGVFGAGSAPSGGTNIMDYITIGSTGNAQDFGDLNYASGSLGGSCSNGVRGVFAHGYGNPDGYASAGKIDYITISTTGNATSFGSIKSSGYWYTGSACASDQGRGVFACGSPGAQTAYYIQISTEANATNAGSLMQERNNCAAASDGTRGTWWGNQDNGAIDYLTLDSLGNSTDFGDMATAVQYSAGTANDTRGTANGGDNDDGYKSQIQHVTIQTTGNATNFGNLTNITRCSQGHSGD